MSGLQYGCQFYTWQMSGEKYVGAMPHICEVVSRAGFAGIEPDVAMMGEYLEDPARLEDLLARLNLELGALCLVCDWRGAVESETERRRADRVIETLGHFPGTHFMLCQMPGGDREDLDERQRHAIACINEVARRATDRGIVCSHHPNSPPGSVFRTRDDYHRMFDLMDERVVGYCPDSGHIINGDMDVYEIFETYLSQIRHVHLKDITSDKTWAPMGQGITDFPRLMEMLKAADYQGWVMVEEESALAETDPDEATRVNGEYLVETLLPLARS